MIKPYTQVSSLRFAIQTGLVFLPAFLIPVVIFALMGISIEYLIRSALACIIIDLVVMWLLYYGDRQTL